MGKNNLFLLTILLLGLVYFCYNKGNSEIENLAKLENLIETKTIISEIKREGGLSHLRHVKVIDIDRNIYAFEFRKGLDKVKLKIGQGIKIYLNSEKKVILTEYDIKSASNHLIVFGMKIHIFHMIAIAFIIVYTLCIVYENIEYLKKSTSQ